MADRVTAEQFQQALARARQLEQGGRRVEAEDVLRTMAVPGPQREPALRALVELHLRSGNTEEAVTALIELTREVPDRLYYCAHLAGLLQSLGRPEEAVTHLLRLVQDSPLLATARYNLALAYKKCLRYTDALASYEEAVRLGIADVQEVYSNMGVLYSDMRRAQQAADMYGKALAVDPLYLPALFNLAGLHEEAGRRVEAVDLYRRILVQDPEHWDALARLANSGAITATGDELLTRLRRAAADDALDATALEGLNFALGKILDELGEYDQAFTAYRRANELGRRRYPGYDRAAVEASFHRLRDLFTPAWVSQRTWSGDSWAPVFIVGMFRSGSTLVEQILARHPAVTAGGELDYLPWVAARRLPPELDRWRELSRDQLGPVREEYRSLVTTLFPDAERVTDKRPDNFLLLGLVHMLFPAARIIHTRRDPLDNCLSIYFQQLGGSPGYHTDLADCAHYYRQYRQLMTHWEACFPERILDIDYEALVEDPEPVVRRMLEFLGLAWDPACLAHGQTDNLVKTASIWQVREGLHTRSRGRWRNYERHLGDILSLLRDIGSA